MYTQLHKKEVGKNIVADALSILCTIGDLSPTLQTVA